MSSAERASAWVGLAVNGHSSLERVVGGRAVGCGWPHGGRDETRPLRHGWSRPPWKVDATTKQRQCVGSAAEEVRSCQNFRVSGRSNAEVNISAVLGHLGRTAASIVDGATATLLLGGGFASTPFRINGSCSDEKTGDNKSMRYKTKPPDDFVVSV